VIQAVILAKNAMQNYALNVLMVELSKMINAFMQMNQILLLKLTICEKNFHFMMLKIYSFVINLKCIFICNNVLRHLLYYK